VSDQELIDHFSSGDGAHGDVLVSTDLTRATDLLPLDLLQAVIDGLRDSGRMSPLELEILEHLAGPQDLLYEEREIGSA